MADLALDDATLDQLAGGIAYNIEYAFAVRWAPRWVKDGEPHHWTEPEGREPTQHFVDCVRCRRLSVHQSATKADACGTSDMQEKST